MKIEKEKRKVGGRQKAPEYREYNKSKKEGTKINKTCSKVKETNKKGSINEKKDNKYIQEEAYRKKNRRGIKIELFVQPSKSSKLLLQLTPLKCGCIKNTEC